MLREARRRAGLSQAELARRAGVTQSVVSAYESSARQPSLPMLDRLVSATGLTLELQLRRRGQRLNGPIGARLRARRNKVRQVADAHGLMNPRVFGSVARGEETESSDVDLLVDVSPGVSLIGLARAQHELEGILETRVELVPAGDLKPGVAASVLAEAIPV